MIDKNKVAQSKSIVWLISILFMSLKLCVWMMIDIFECPNLNLNFYFFDLYMQQNISKLEHNKSAQLICTLSTVFATKHGSKNRTCGRIEHCWDLTLVLDQHSLCQQWTYSQHVEGVSATTPLSQKGNSLLKSFLISALSYEEIVTWHLYIITKQIEMLYFSLENAKY